MPDITLSVPQSQFVTLDCPRAAFVGGVGSGKSFAIGIMAHMLRVNYPDAHGFIAANTYKQLTKATLAGVFKCWESCGLQLGRDFFYHKTNHTITFPGQKAMITCGSLEEYDNWRGIEIGWFLGDEAAYYVEAAYDMFVGRLRDKRGPLWMRLASTPKGYNWLYDRFADDDDAVVINAATNSNTHLPEEYLKSLESQYDPEVYKQEVLGQFVNLNTGAVYRMFTPDLVTEFADRLPGEQVNWCNDFNVMPMTALAFVVRGNTLCVFDEVWLNDATTYDMAQIMRETHPTSVECYPDASGNARKSSSTKTDHQILRENGFRVRASGANPSVRDRWNCVNGLMHHKRVMIHPRCKKLIRDLQRLTHDNKDATLGHISDAFGYGCWGLFPLKRKAAFREG